MAAELRFSLYGCRRMRFCVFFGRQADLRGVILILCNCASAARSNQQMWNHPYSRFPRATCPPNRKVLGSLPEPHSLNVPKSLYQSPSGTSGSSAFHSANANRSS